MSKSPRTTLKTGVSLPSIIFIIIISLLAGFYPTLMENILEVAKEFIFENLNWILVWSVGIFIVFLIYLMFSKYGKIRLGANDSLPDHSFFSWISMLFAAGMGIGLMYFSVAEPMQHYTAEVFAGNSHAQRAQDAQLFTFFSIGEFTHGQFMLLLVWRWPILRIVINYPYP